MKKALIALFAVVALAQWYAPVSMIWKSENVLKKGKAFQFQTEPVDPEDPLRGRYVRLSFKADGIVIKNSGFHPGDEVFAEIDTDAKGYARIKSLRKQPPANSNDYIAVNVNYVVADEQRVLVDYPFEEFYLDEYKAPKAETLYRQSTADSTSNTYALVNVYRGKAVIRDLIINNKSIYSYFK